MTYHIDPDWVQPKDCSCLVQGSTWLVAGECTWHGVDAPPERKAKHQPVKREFPRPSPGYDNPLPILLAGRAVYSVRTPLGWRHLDISKDAFDRHYFLPAIEGRKADHDAYARESARAHDLLDG